MVTADTHTDVEPEWWRTFYSGLAWEMLRQVKSEDETQSEANFIVRSLRPPPQGRLLDVPCGNGRLSIELALRGYELTGIDLMPDLIEAAKITAGKHGIDMELRCGDMRDLPWQAEFDGAFCLWGSFGYFDDTENLRFLKAVAQSLKPGARFLLDTPILEMLLPGFEESTQKQIGDVLVSEERHFDHITARINREWTLLRDGTTEKRQSSMRIYTFRELAAMMEEAGFDRCQGYGSLNHEPFRVGHKRFYMLASRSEE